MSQSAQRLSRRDVLRRVPMAAALLAAHELPGQILTSQPGDGAQAPARSVEPRIRALRLLTAVPLARMRSFYHDKIGFDIAEDGKSEVTFRAGATRLTFATARPEDIRGKGGRGNGEPMYHFAFNIPCNKIRDARAWQSRRTPLVPPRREARDENLPGDVWHFRHWNAHSVFFFDPAFNIVEYIARHDLKNEAADADRFDTHDILHASEIGYVTTRADQAKAIGFMREKLGLSEYPRGADPWAMGDERGLLLCLARVGEQWAEHTQTPVNWGVFPTECTIRGPKAGAYEMDGLPYIIRAE